MTQEGEKGTAVYVEDFYGETQTQGHVLVFFFFFPLNSVDVHTKKNPLASFYG